MFFLKHAEVSSILCKFTPLESPAARSGDDGCSFLLVQFIAYCHIAIESQNMRSNKGDGSIYFKFSIPENRAVPFSMRSCSFELSAYTFHLINGAMT
jgi:hypothetical protein